MLAGYPASAVPGRSSPPSPLMLRSIVHPRSRRRPLALAVFLSRSAGTRSTDSARIDAALFGRVFRCSRRVAASGASLVRRVMRRRLSAPAFRYPRDDSRGLVGPLSASKLSRVSVP